MFNREKQEMKRVPMMPVRDMVIFPQQMTPFIVGREASVRALGALPHVQVVLDDSWSTDKITAAGRDKLREAGFAPPTPRAATNLLQLNGAIFRCPYCGSTDTRLENLFGPTPCRSLRYCTSCRQPFEQFKTI